MKKTHLISGIEDLPGMLMRRVAVYGIRPTARKLGIPHTTLQGWAAQPGLMPVSAAASLAKQFGAQLVLAVHFPRVWSAENSKELAKADAKALKPKRVRAA